MPSEAPTAAGRSPAKHMLPGDAPSEDMNVCGWVGCYELIGRDHGHGMLVGYVLCGGGNWCELSVAH